jgi:diguanylate cyclase (GGDEF)-like protein
MRSASVMLYGLYGAVPDLISIDLSNVILFSAFGVTWNGARVFNGRAALPGSLMAGAVLWLFASLWPGFEAGAEARGQLSAMIIAVYIWLTAFEFWRGRSEPLVSRWPAIVLFATHGTMFLTGLLNRRAFLQDAEALLLQQISRDRPIGVLLIDLDHFKSINDRFGHAAGDKVLQIFAKTALANLRQNDLVGRLGGEEFTVVLADASIDNAYLVADRVRNSFAVAAAVVDGQPLHATASIGVSVIVDPSQDLARLMTLADQALYLAKARGRNRVEVAPFGIDLGEDVHGAAVPRQSAA